MGKIAIWILIALAVMLVLRLIGTSKRRVDDAASKPGPDGQGRARQADGRGEERRDGGELMMSCAVCGIHIPASDAVFARGKVFCGADHRDLAERDDA
jgi:uncharacterized protein